jgi:hypothetical protein
MTSGVIDVANADFLKAYIYSEFKLVVLVYAQTLCWTSTFMQLEIG